MNSVTVRRLNLINAEFYNEQAGDFGRTRSRPWPGWRRVVESLEAPESRPLSVLDVGCGNARLVLALAERFERFDYVGIDSSEPLLEQARARIESLEGVNGRLTAIDLVDELPSERLADRRFDLVAAFGLFHHLPGFSLRRRLLIDLAALLRPSGLIAAGFWQFGAHERFRRRFVDWQSFNEGASDPVDLDQLEPGDHLLAWGERGGAIRYCHWADPAEVERLLAAAGLTADELYQADGAGAALNLYALVRGGGDAS